MTPLDETVGPVGLVTAGRPALSRHAAQDERGGDGRNPAMIAHIGDQIVLEGTHLGNARRVGVVTGIGGAEGHPPYQVRWLDDGHTTLIFPGAEARIEPAASGVKS